MVSVLSVAGGNPILCAAILPTITGAMEGMTPPLALCMYTAMGIADSPMKETTANCIIWCVIHYFMSVIVLLGFLPILGL
jgi:TRAP-type C4-dicarboxylate transport system permease large subunit